LLTDGRPGAELPISIHEMVCRRGGTAVAGVEQDILARPLPGPLASHLGARPGTMTLLFVRRYRDAKGSVIVWSLNWHPADRFVYRMRLDRSAS
jgi:DNA-binding GntR family transcriptional regulator